MAHFAELDQNGVVLRVVVVNNATIKGPVTTEVNGFLMTQEVESEAQGIEFLQGLYGSDTTWKQTSYNGKFRGVFAAVGGTFENGAFVAPVFVAPVTTEQIGDINTAPVQSLSTDQLQSLSSAQLQALTTAQVQSLSTAQISQLGA